MTDPSRWPPIILDRDLLMMSALLWLIGWNVLSEPSLSGEVTTPALADDKSQSEVKHYGPNTSCWLDLEYRNWGMSKADFKDNIFGGSSLSWRGELGVISQRWLCRNIFWVSILLVNMRSASFRILLNPFIIIHLFLPQQSTQTAGPRC